MQGTDWRISGDWIKNCNCAFGCPCDFMAAPTHGECHGLLGMRIERGHFGNTRLDGLSFFVVVAFPGPLHEGNGRAQAIIDERATPEQRDALFQILSGKHAAEGTLFHIFSLIVTQLHEPVFAPIEVAFDMEHRTAKVSVPGVLETETAPIRNPVTGSEYRIQVAIPGGFEHHRAEVASASIDSTGGIKFTVPVGHSSLARVTQTPAGVVS
jgi:hypothetical protein